MNDENEYDLGNICVTDNGKAIKVTVNKFKDTWYVHIREYIQDLDDGTWFPTKKGIALRAEYVDVAANMFSTAGALLSNIYLQEVIDIINEDK